MENWVWGRGEINFETSGGAGLEEETLGKGDGGATENRKREREKRETEWKRRGGEKREMYL